MTKQVVYHPSGSHSSCTTSHSEVRYNNQIRQCIKALSSVFDVINFKIMFQNQKKYNANFTAIAINMVIVSF